MLKKFDHTTKEHKNSNTKRNAKMQTIVKLAIIVAVVLVQVGSQADMGLAAGRTTLVYNPMSFQLGDDIMNGQLRWSYDHATPSRSGFPIANVWNGGTYLTQRWTTFYNVSNRGYTVYDRANSNGQTFYVVHSIVVDRFNIGTNGNIEWVSDPDADATYAWVFFELRLTFNCSGCGEYPAALYRENQLFTYSYKTEASY